MLRTSALNVLTSLEPHYCYSEHKAFAPSKPSLKKLCLSKLEEDVSGLKIKNNRRETSS
jgi:hypothetical protein